MHQNFHIRTFGAPKYQHALTVTQVCDHTEKTKKEIRGNQAN